MLNLEPTFFEADKFEVLRLDCELLRLLGWSFGFSSELVEVLLNWSLEPAAAEALGINNNEEVLAPPSSVGTTILSIPAVICAVGSSELL